MPRLRGLSLSALALSLLAPALAHGQRCVVDVVVMNVDRRVSGPVSVECSRPHSVPFGNWGAEFPYFGVQRLRDGYQFSGWKAEDGWLQWNSCTTDFAPPDPLYYNDDDYTAQVAMPNVVNVVESRREHSYTGLEGVTCERLLDNPVIEFGSATEPIELKVYELDRRILIDGPDHVATLSYDPIAVPYLCEDEWSCRGESEWVRPASGDDRVFARLKLEVHLRKAE